ncbi:MAG: IS30 family transposase [Pseudomonadota bacterium]
MQESLPLGGQVGQQDGGGHDAGDRPHLSAHPRSLRKTLTLDNVKEFARFTAIENDTGLVISFADPYAASQRGCNENTNGLLRRYFPKGTDFRTITEERLASIVKNLNHRPRKCLWLPDPS